MSAEPDISRRCKDCADTTHTVCCFVFGKFWRNKSRNGHGCSHPLDAVAEAWEKANRKGETVQIALPPKEADNSKKYEQDDLFKPKELTEEDY